MGAGGCGVGIDECREGVGMCMYGCMWALSLMAVECVCCLQGCEIQLVSV